MFRYRTIRPVALKVAGAVCFEPLQAPSSFCWERISADEVRVTQRWTDAEGAAQQYARSLGRI